MGLFGNTPEKRGEKIALLLRHYILDNNREKIEALLKKEVILPESHGDLGILALAIHYGHQEIIDRCIKQKIALNIRGHYGYTPLFTALDRRMQQTAREVFEAGGDYQAKDVLGRTALMLALRNGDLWLAGQLVAKGQSLQAAYGHRSCIRSAVESGDIAVIEYVLAAQPPLDPTLLFTAIDTNNPDIFFRLVKAGCVIDPSAKCPSSGKRLISYARSKAPYSIISAINPLAVEKQKEKKAAAAAKKQKKVAMELAKRTGWRLNTPQEVCRMTEPAQIPYRTTEIFNFHSGLYTRINQNRETRAESTAIMNISDIANRAFVAEAMAQLDVLGGQLPQDTTFIQSPIKRVISKPQSPTE